MKFSLVLLAVSFLLGIIFGEVYIPPQYLFFPRGVYLEILLYIRLPTVFASAMIGAILAVSGAVMQLLLRNPLMDPYVSGTASGGAFGAVLTYFLLAFNLPFSWIIYISPVIAFLFALLSTVLTLLIGRRTGVYGLVIGGVVVSYIFSSLITVMLTFLEIRYPQVPPLYFWLLGDVELVGWENDAILLVLLILLLGLGTYTARLIDLASISDDMTFSKDVNPNNFRLLWIGLMSIAVGFIVSLVGIVGFVGIIVPHIVRRFHSGSATRLIPESSVLGAAITVLSESDLNGALGVKIPITAITALIAAPIIIYLLVRAVANSGIQG
ncbi:MAG: iron ABC transporter permease [Metallosphaera yellowstonensis]